jgi:hypothetical protein
LEDFGDLLQAKSLEEEEKLRLFDNKSFFKEAFLRELSKH